MAETTTPEIDVKTRANLAYLWSIALILFVGYIIFRFGNILAILTLMIGFVTGTAATVLAVYFGAPIGVKKADTNVVQQTGDNPVNNVTPPTDPTPTP